MSPRFPPRPERHEIVDAIVDEVRDVPRTDVPDPTAQAEARRDAIAADATTALVPRGEPTLYGSKAFFRRAAEELASSTEHGRELAGAAYLKNKGGRLLLVGLRRATTGFPGKVPIDPAWGSVLWHTHPGLRGSLAAFSNEDLEVARRSNKPLLVIGFGGLSADVLTTLALPFGMRAFVASAGVKGLLALEKRGLLSRRLLRLGVAARVCWPSGVIRPVLRADARPLEAALDDMSFVIDAGVGAVERAGQRAVKQVVSMLLPGDRS